MLQKIDKTYWVVFLIIGGITGVLSGMIGPDLIHHTFFKHDDTFMVITPFSANLSMFIATGFFVLFCMGMIFLKNVWTYVSLIFLVLSIATGCYGLIGNYTLISKSDITVVKSMQKEVYEWDEIVEATYLDDKYESNGREILLVFKDGHQQTVEINSVNIVKLIENLLGTNHIQIN